jgi:DNA polymerase-3 subunit alpha
LKIKNVKPLNDGLTELSAGQIFDDIEKFAAYSFPKAHGTAYAIISYWSMWLKQHYPAEFYAAAMTNLDTDKLPNLVAAAELDGIEILPPDVNRSMKHYAVFEENGKQYLVAPLSAVKGVAAAAEDSIISAREASQRLYETFIDFTSRVDRRKVHKGVQSVLDRVGAFSTLEPITDDKQVELLKKDYPHYSIDQLPANHKDRVPHHLELLPGIIKVESVSKVISKDKHILTQLKEQVLQPIFESPCSQCSLCKNKHVPYRFGKKAKIMVVTDSPTYGEEDKGKMVEGLGSDYVREALEKSGFSVADFYFTTLVKSRKPKGSRLKPDQISACSVYLDKEIDILKPGMIVALGSETIRHLIKGSKYTQDDAGKVVFSQSLGCAIVLGLSPQTVYVKNEAQSALNAVFETVKRLLG